MRISGRSTRGTTGGHTWRRTALVGAMVGAAALATALAVPDGDRAAYAAEDAPVLRMERARATIQAPRFGRIAYVDLGTHLVAGAQPFEVRVTRDPEYAQKLTAVLQGADSGTTLPAGSAAEDWSGLADFFQVTIKDAKGKKVYADSLPFCPNSSEQTRRDKDAPSTSPYPYGCQANPYGLGQVWGLQQGFSTPTTEGLGLPLKLGTYTATVSIADAYVQSLGLSGATTSQTVKVKVVKGSEDDFWRTGARSASSGHSAHSGHSMSSMSSGRSGHSGHAGSTAPVRHTKATWDDPRRSSAYPTPSKKRMQALEETSEAPDSTVAPDLRSLPAWGIQVSRGRYLTFSATVWNAGPSPLVVDGFKRDGDEDLMDAFQYYFDADGKQLGYDEVGTMEWDARKGHNHWHFTDFASYRLLDADQQLLVRSSKEAFCLANTDAVDYTVAGANWRPDGTDLHTSCGQRSSVAVRQTLETGSGDTYGQFLPGQSFDLKGLKNGTYYIQVLANPENKLHEASTSNNASLRKVTIGGKTGKRTVKVAKVGVISEFDQF